ncbi:MAG: hypothetical protein DU429_08395 [Candidatus Tokpelaia sp.]|nr:MAG: hypothetical protein DU429_08395 [Candidatus Tokpelaia sp.]
MQCLCFVAGTVLGLAAACGWRAGDRNKRRGEVKAGAAAGGSLGCWGKYDSGRKPAGSGMWGLVAV